MNSHGTSLYLNGPLLECDSVWNHSQLKCLFHSLSRLTAYKAPDVCRFARWIHRWPVFSPHKGAAMWKAFLYHNVRYVIFVMYCTFRHIIRARRNPASHPRLRQVLLQLSWMCPAFYDGHQELWGDSPDSRGHYPLALAQTQFSQLPTPGWHHRRPGTSKGRHDDVIKWKYFPRNWSFVRGIHRSRWIPHTKASDAELWCFLWSAS